MRRKPNGRLAFTPSAEAREYFDGLRARLQAERGLNVHVTQREAFDALIRYARMVEGRERMLGRRAS
jgi:hypothetical protein